MTFAAFVVPRGGGEHGDVLADGVGRDERALVAGDGAHRGQSVHSSAPRWCAVAASFEKTVTPCLGELLYEIWLLRPVEEADQDLALAQEPDLLLRRALYFDYYVGFAVDAIRARLRSLPLLLRSPRRGCSRGPRPVCTMTSKPSLTSLPTVSGTSPTLRSPSATSRGIPTFTRQIIASEPYLRFRGPAVTNKTPFCNGLSPSGLKVSLSTIVSDRERGRGR